MIRLSEPFRCLLYIPFYLAQSMGAFAAEGLDVRLTTAASPADAVRALLAGEVDLCWGGPMRLLRHHDADPDCPLVAFAEAVTRDPFMLVGMGARPGFALADLSGLRFATVSEVDTPWLCLQHDLRQAGMDPGALPRVTGRSVADNAADLLNGRLDVVQAFEPYAEQVVQAGGAVWHAAAARGHTAYTSYITLRPLLEARREEWLRVARALYRTEKWLALASADRVVAAAASWFPAVPARLLGGAIARYQQLGIWNREPVLSRDGFDRLKAAMRSYGWLTRDPPYEECVDTELARQAIAEDPPPVKD